MFDRRLTRLESKAPAERPLRIVFADDPNEPLETAWARQFPGEAFAPERFHILHISFSASQEAAP